MIEAIPTWNGERESVELYCQYHFNEFNSEKITEVIKDYLEQVKARYNAVKVEKLENINILLRPKEFLEVIDELAYDLTYANVYTHSNRTSIGTKLQDNPNGSLLTVLAKGSIKGSVDSKSFDRDGTTLKDKVIIEDGVVVGYFGVRQHAEYLKMEAKLDEIVLCIHFCLPLAV